MDSHLKEPTSVDTASTPNAAPPEAGLGASLRSASAVLDRILFMRQAGLTFGGKRDMYEALGYSRSVSAKEYRDRYARGGIAGRIVDALPTATWRGTMELQEDEDPKVSTQFEEAWSALETRLKITAVLQRSDILSRLSTYSVLLIGAPGELEVELPKGRPEDLLYLTPFSGGGGPAVSGNSSATRRGETGSSYVDATIESFVTDPKDPRFGLPEFYSIKRLNPSTPGAATKVHWTRVLHLAEGVLDDEVYGAPALERVWNLLDDLDKVTGGGAEAFWLRANQGLNVNIDKDVSVTPEDLAKLKDETDEYQHSISRILKTRGTTVKTLGSDVANFSNPADAILTQIAGATSIPKRILTGSEMGELASSQDRDNWRDQVIGRQTAYVGPYVVRPLVDRLVKYGYLPTPKSYSVKWPHIQTLTELEKTQGAAAWANANKTQGSTIFTDDEIREKWYSLEPLTPEQKVAVPAPPPTPPPEPLLTVAEEADLLRVLEAALEGNDVETIDRICGISHA